MSSAVFDKSKRLLTSKDFTAVFEGARFRVSHRHFLLLARPTDAGHPRLGLVVGKKNARLATRRNRIKRVVRETFRHRIGCLDSLDIVFLVRKGFDNLPPAEQTRLLEQSWRKLAAKSGGGE